MSREEARNLLTNSFGIEEPTDAQISAYLNSLNAEVKKAENKAERYKEDAEKVKELQAKLDEIANQNLSDIEKANKATETANAMVADLEKKVKAMETTNALANIGIVGDDATNLIGEDGAINFELLGSIISNRETSAVANYKLEALKNTPNSVVNKNENEGNEPNEIVSKVVASMGANSVNMDGLNAYK